MTNILKKSFLALACIVFATTAWSAAIYETEFVENPSGAKTTAEKGEFTTPPDWASDYSSCYHTTGSAGAVTLTFEPAIDLSAYSNCKLTFYWGASSNRPVNLEVNGGSKTEIDKVGSSGERSQVRETSIDLSVTSITSLRFSGSGGGNSYYFRFVITSGEGGGSTPDPEDNNPVVTDMTFTDQEGKAVIDATAGTITAQIKNGGNLSAIEPKFTGTNITEWTPTGAQDFSNGPVDYSISGKGPVVNFTITITEAEEEKPDTPTPSGDIYAHWRFSGGDPPADNTYEDGTNIRVEFLTDGSKSFTNESAAYNDAVPDDMKSQGSKGVKSGGNVLFLKVTTLNGQGFKKEDVVTICGYNPWIISSTADHTGDISASLATGTKKEDYNIGSVTLPADAEALFLKRAKAQEPVSAPSK